MIEAVQPAGNACVMIKLTDPKQFVIDGFLRDLRALRGKIIMVFKILTSLSNLPGL